MWENSPIFGYVPVEFQEWFLKESGTFYKQDHWVVDVNQLLNKTEIESWASSRFKKEIKKPIRYFQADKFQNNMATARAYIQDYLFEKNIVLTSHDEYFGNKEIFSLLKNRFVDIKYKFNGFDCIEHIEA